MKPTDFRTRAVSNRWSPALRLFLVVAALVVTGMVVTWAQGPAEPPPAPAAPTPSPQAPPAPPAPVASAAPQAPAPAPAAPATPARPAAPTQPATPAVPAAPQAPDPPDAPVADDDSDTDFRSARPIVRVGQDFDLPAGQRAREVVVVFGSVTIGGEVDRDVVAVLGTIHLESTARVGGSVVAPVGSITVEDGAVVNRDLVSVLGGVDAPASFSPGGDYVVVSPPGFGRVGEVVVPYFTRGLLWGRLIVPSLPWMWTIVAVILVVYLVLNMLFDKAVRTCRRVLVERPLSAFLVGLLVLVLIGPVAFILSVSIVGIPVLPFLACGLFIAALLGKVAVSRWIGGSLIVDEDPENRLQALSSFLLGSLVIILAYMVPVLGIFVFAVGSMFGLGAATVAFSSGLRRENPARRRPTAPTVPGVTAAGAAVAPGGDESPLQASSADPDDAVTGDGPAALFTAPPIVPPPPPPTGGAPAAATAGVSAAALASLPKAPFLDRLGAFALDVLLVSIAYNLLDLNSSRAFFVLLLGYHIVFWGLKATTVGGIICNVRVVRTDGMPLTYTDALIRGLSSIFSIVALGIGFFWILFDPDSQSWHDRFAGTWVVKVPRSWPV